MEFQVKLPAPGRKPFSVHPFLKQVEEFLYKCLSGPGASGYPKFHAPAFLQHLLCGAAASVSVAEACQHILAYILILVSLPCSHHLAYILPPVVGGIKGRILAVRVLIIILCGNQIRQNLASVNPSPHKRIVRKFVILIPADFCSHKIGNA